MSEPQSAWLAKDCLDVGVFTNNLESMLGFWQTQVGLAFDHLLRVGGGIHQHRHDHLGSVFKLNHSRTALPPRTPAGYLKLYVAKLDVTATIELVDPDGNQVVLVPVGHAGIGQWAIEVATASADEFFAFYSQGLGLPRLSGHDCAVYCGRSQIIGCLDALLTPTSATEHSNGMLAVGYRYTTIQVKDVDAMHARVMAAGATEGRAPMSLGKTARISFVRDPQGNWLELSQRASLTGPITDPLED